MIAPALYVGAMVGAAAGAIIGLFLGEQASAQVYFGVVGMAACLAVLLDAPFAAALLALELSSRPEIAAAALVASLIACFVVRTFAPQPALEDQIDRTMRWR
jgi:CIC family chloride channel protein